jgi:hypothetical protein
MSPPGGQDVKRRTLVYSTSSGGGHPAAGTPNNQKMNKKTSSKSSAMKPTTSSQGSNQKSDESAQAESFGGAEQVITFSQYNLSAAKDQGSSSNSPSKPPKKIDSVKPNSPQTGDASSTPQQPKRRQSSGNKSGRNSRDSLRPHQQQRQKQQQPQRQENSARTQEEQILFERMVASRRNPETLTPSAQPHYDVPEQPLISHHNVPSQGRRRSRKSQGGARSSQDSLPPDAQTSGQVPAQVRRKSQNGKQHGRVNALPSKLPSPNDSYLYQNIFLNQGSSDPSKKSLYTPSTPLSGQSSNFTPTPRNTNNSSRPGSNASSNRRSPYEEYIL